MSATTPVGLTLLRLTAFFGLAVPVVHVTGTDGKAVRLSLATDSGLCVSGQPDASTWPESSDLQPDLVLVLTARLRTSTLSATPMAEDARPSEKGMYYRVQCLIDELPDDLTAEQCGRMEAGFLFRLAY